MLSLFYLFNSLLATYLSDHATICGRPSLSVQMFAYFHAILTMIDELRRMEAAGTAWHHPWIHKEFWYTIDLVLFVHASETLGGCGYGHVLFLWYLISALYIRRPR